MFHFKYKPILVIAGLFISQVASAQQVNRSKVQDSLLHKSDTTTHELKQVVVENKRSLVEQKMDRTIINVDASPSNVGANVIEVLEKSPGVAVDKDGHISLKGKNAVLVMIDGRPSYLSATDLYNYLKSLPSTAVDQIELMTNPPAKYDASGNAGVINIKTKKNKTMGFNGTYTISTGQGVYNRNANSLNLNYRKNKINVFSNMSYSNYNGFSNINILRSIQNSSKINIANIDQKASEKNNEHNNINLKIGVDYAISKKTNMGFVVTGFTNPEQSLSTNTSFLMNANNVVDSIVRSINSIENKWKNISSNFYVQHRFDSTGTELSFDIDASKFNSSRKSILTNAISNPNYSFRSNDELLGNFPIDIQIFSIKSDFSRPLKNKAKFEMGAKSSYVETTNGDNFFNVINHMNFIDYNKTNSFDYKENINAAYLNYNKEIGKWGFQLGLRAENTNASGYQKGNAQKSDSSFSRNYTNLFPTSYISYALNDKNQFVVNYGKRIDRPGYQDLNPFIFYLDNYTYNAGNPFLKPQISHNFELSHTYKQFLTTTFNYGKTSDVITQSFSQMGYATMQSNSNLGTKINYGASISARLNAKKILTSNIYLNYTHSDYNGSINNAPIDIVADIFILSLNNQLKFNKEWSGELSGWYRSKGAEGQIMINPISEVTLALQKQVLKSKGTIKLSIRDVLLSNYTVGVITFNQTVANFIQTRDSRTISIGFTYRFGKNFKPVSKRTSGADDEKAE